LKYVKYTHFTFLNTLKKKITINLIFRKKNMKYLILKNMKNTNKFLIYMIHSAQRSNKLNNYGILYVYVFHILPILKSYVLKLRATLIAVV
jgi:hypothetical protein